MANVLTDGSAVVVSDGVTTEDKKQDKEQQWEHIGGDDVHKAHIERRFPMEVAEKLLSTRLHHQPPSPG